MNYSVFISCDRWGDRCSGCFIHSFFIFQLILSVRGCSGVLLYRSGSSKVSQAPSCVSVHITSSWWVCPVSSPKTAWHPGLGWELCHWGDCGTLINQNKVHLDWIYLTKEGFLGSSDGKEWSTVRIPGFAPWVWKMPWIREWLPTPVFLPGQSHGQRRLEGYSLWGHKESDTTEQFTLSQPRKERRKLYFIKRAGTNVASRFS